MNRQPDRGLIPRCPFDSVSLVAGYWDQADAVGEGEEYRADFADDHASALTFEETVVHGSGVAGV